jgi:hypothetical protein
LAVFFATKTTANPAREIMRNIFNFLSISWSFIFSLFLLLVHFQRRNDNAEFFHHIERLPEYITRRLQFDSHEHLGRRLYVLHLCIAAGICLCQLRGKEASIAQCCLSTRRESRNSGKQIIALLSALFV